MPTVTENDTGGQVAGDVKSATPGGCGWRRRSQPGSAERGESHMGTLAIKGVVQDANDRTGQTFLLSFKRDLKPFERFTVPLQLSRHFSPTEAGGPADVTITQAHPDFFTNPETR